MTSENEIKKIKAINNNVNPISNYREENTNNSKENNNPISNNDKEINHNNKEFNNRKKINFMNLPEEYTGEDSKFLIVSIPWEYNASYGKGASKAPEEIINASKQLEYFDIETEKEIFERGINLKEIKFNSKEIPEIAINKIKEFSEKINLKNQFPVFLGGDHSITIGIVKGIEQQKEKEEFDVIVFDAHADFFYSWNDSILNHRCVNRQLISEHNIFIIGLRSCDVEEFNQIKENNDIDYVLGSELINNSKDVSLDIIKSKLKNLKRKVYISIDVDVFDPSFIRNTGTPEPGGFLWNQLLELLEIIFQEKKIIGVDVVEFAPISNYRSEAYSLAKLVHKLMIFKDLQQ